jgi:predicted GNAT family acetyltransferase
MLQILFETRPDLFLSRVGAHLMPHLAEHNLILSLCEAAQKKISAGQGSQLRLMSFLQDNQFILCGAQTPKMNLVLSRSAETHFRPVTDILLQHGVDFPGIVGPSDVTASFIQAWAAGGGQEPKEFMDQIIYSLHKVTMPATKEGGLRAAQVSEVAQVAEWMRAFAQETLPKSEHLDEASALSRAADVIAQQRAFVWDVGGAALSLATVGGTQSAARIGTVYTPEKLRGRGYASALVANLSQKKLKDGADICCLYADARNPVSNSIYRKIGYEFVGRSSHYVF